MSEPLPLRFGRDFAAGEILFREGEHGDEMYVIQSGLVQILKRVGEGHRALAMLGPGEFLGDMAILNGRPRTATALVLEHARCLVIDRATLEQMVTTNAEIALRLVKNLARRLASADEMIQMLLDPDPHARVLLAVKRHAETGDETPAGVRLHASDAEVAREVGVDRSQVRDVLLRLRRLGIAAEDEGDGAITIMDLPRLLEFMEILEMPQKLEA
jgi:CRP/FNR family cyclic AMP-dependent transcriptional regulator